MIDDDFNLQFKEFLARNGRQAGQSAADIIGRWEDVIDECSECYGWGFAEFDNDIRVRDLIERALTDPALAEFEQMKAMKNRIKLADERFRKLLSPTQIREEGRPWWIRCVLARAGEEYRDDMKQIYGIDIDLCG